MSYFLVAAGKHARSYDLEQYDLREEMETPDTAYRHIVLNEPNLKIRAVLSSKVSGLISEPREGIETEKGLVFYFGVSYQKNGSNFVDLDQNSLQQILDEETPFTKLSQTLDGVFCFVYYCKRRQQVFLTGNYWNYFTFYYSLQNETILFSSRSAILADLTNSELDGISQIAILRNTAPPPERTLFHRVKNKLPGESFVIDLASGSVSRSCDTLSFSRNRKVDFDESLQQITSPLLHIVAREHCVVDITSGQNTRVTSSILSRHRELIERNHLVFKTMGVDEDIDMIVARQICELNGWRHMHEPRRMEEEYSVENARKAAIAYDGSVLANYNNSCYFERVKNRASEFDEKVLVSSWGCEFLRDGLMLNEYVVRTMGKKVDLDRNFRDRFYSDPRVDVNRISNGKLSIQDHNELFLTKYREFWDGTNADLAKKLEYIGAMKTMQKHRLSWGHLTCRLTILPYISPSIFNVGYSLPLSEKMFNNFIGKIISECAPHLRKFKTNRGAKLGYSGIPAILNAGVYYPREYWRLLKNHALPKAPKPEPYLSLPKWWFEVFSQSERFFPMRSVAEKELSYQDVNEILSVITVHFLTERYKNIKPVLVFE